MTGDMNEVDNNDDWDEEAIDQVSQYIKERLCKWNLDLVEAEKIERNQIKDTLNSEDDSNSITTFGTADYAHSQDSFDDRAELENQAIEKKKPATRTRNKFVSAFQEDTKLQEQVMVHVREKQAFKQQNEF